MKGHRGLRSRATVTLALATLAVGAGLSSAACGGSITPGVWYTSSGSSAPTHALPPTVSMNPLAAPMPTYLSELTPSTSHVGWGVFSAGHYRFSSPDDEVNEGDPIVTHGVWYSRGLFAHAPSRLTYDIGGKYSEFRATLSMVDWITSSREDGAVFIVKLDGAEIFRSQTIFPNSKPRDVGLSVAGGQRLELITDPTGNKGYDWTIWGDPFLR